MDHQTKRMIYFVRIGDTNRALSRGKQNIDPEPGIKMLPLLLLLLPMRQPCGLFGSCSNIKPWEIDGHNIINYHHGWNYKRPTSRASKWHIANCCLPDRLPMHNSIISLLNFTKRNILFFQAAYIRKLIRVLQILCMHLTLCAIPMVQCKFWTAKLICRTVWNSIPGR